MPAGQVKRYTRQLLLGLSHRQDSGYVHCDIKPDNVLLVLSEDGDFVAKIADFWLAKRRSREFDHVKGTPCYLAPETVVHGVQDCASDIWALGCVVYEMLTGYSIWPLGFNETTDDLYHKIASEEPYLAFRFPGETEAFLRACFVRTPADRPTAKTL
ncbi:mitogen-activated protein kinase kinase kinase 17-like [Tripterygium wilfordii]|uniref:mitogen-activated protein kinase kinase kinase 17-like n=1 Tax=Tripterygium wilfordii TaxID=458696 RepID=UPI0018F82C3E|nr:mitogen-activated protein kinase kinase kinase 17-like [Tripterygium wilfordii]